MRAEASGRSLYPFTKHERSKFGFRFDASLMGYEGRMSTMPGFLLVVVVRGTLGLSIGATLGVTGYLAIVWFFWTPTWSINELFALRVVGVGVGAATGGFIGWLNPGDSRPSVLITLGLAVIGGFAGAVGSAVYANSAYPEALSASQAVMLPMCVGGALSSNLFASVPVLYGHVRGRGV